MASSIILLLVFAFAGAMYLAHMRIVREPFSVTPSAVGWLVVAAVLSYVGNYYQLRAVGTAPNPGYAVAIVGLQAVGVMLISFVFLGATLSWVKAAGVVLCCVGVILLVM